SFGMAMQVFGHEPRSAAWLAAVRKAGSVARAMLGTSRRMHAVHVPFGPVDLRAIEPPLPIFDQALNASGIFEDAQQLCARRGRFVSLESGCALSAAHWTAPLAIKAKGVPNIYTIHDLVPLQFPYFVLDRKGRMARLLAAVAREADLITTVSEASKRQIMDLLGCRSSRSASRISPWRPCRRSTKRMRNGWSHRSTMHNQMDMGFSWVQ